MNGPKPTAHEYLTGRRRIFTVEESGLLGVDTPFWSALTPGKIPQRAGWLAGALKRVEGCDLVLLAVVRCAGGLAGMQNFDGARRLTNRLQWTLTRMGPMTTINTADDLIEVLKSDDKVRSAVRRELLTEELVALPERFDQMLETQTEMLKTQTSILEDIKGIREEQTALRKKHEADRQEYIQVMHWFRDIDAEDAATKNRVRIAKHFTRLRNMRQIKPSRRSCSQGTVLPTPSC